MWTHNSRKIGALYQYYVKDVVPQETFHRLEIVSSGVAGRYPDCALSRIFLAMKLPMPGAVV